MLRETAPNVRVDLSEGYARISKVEVVLPTFQVPVQFLKLFFRFLSRGYLAHAGLVQTGVIDRDRSLCGKTHQNPFGALAEHTRLRMSEE